MLNIQDQHILQAVMQLVEKGYLPPHLYHGTDTRAVPGIQQQGLLPHNSFHTTLGPRVFFTHSPDQASNWAKITADHSNPRDSYRRWVSVDQGPVGEQPGAVLLRAALSDPRIASRIDNKSLLTILNEYKDAFKDVRGRPVPWNPLQRSLASSIFETTLTGPIPPDALDALVHDVVGTGSGTMIQKTWKNLAKLGKGASFALPLLALLALVGQGKNNE